jgi:transposase
MESVHIERLDHVGLMASVRKDLRLMRMIDARLVPDEHEEMTPGEAVAGMILNGLGFAKRPLSLTPQFFANKPLDLLLRAGIRAEMCNRCKLGRTLDEVPTYGCDLLFSELALAVCGQEGLEQRFHHLDTTRFSLSGAYVPESDEQALLITHGYAKDHRPDLQPAVLELLVSPDGGVPLVSKSWDGNTSDTPIFQERAHALMTAFVSAPTPRSLVAAAKLDTEASAAPLSKLGFGTRIPGTRKLVSQVISHAREWDRWHALDARTRSHGLALCHDGMAQRWLVVSSQAALERAEASVTTAPQREGETLENPLFHWQAKRCERPEAAQAALVVLTQAWRYHQVERCQLIAHKHSAGTGRPTPTSPSTSIDWQMHARARPDHERITLRTQQGACCVIGTTIDAGHVSAVEVIQVYKAQAQAEGGFRFLKDPVFFVSSVFVKKPWRMQGLLMVMTLALLVYAVTQRRRRGQVGRQHDTIPHQINQPTERPTLRWIFQLLEGIHRVRVTVQGTVHDLMEGLNEVQSKILRLCGEEVCRLYQISPG